MHINTVNVKGMFVIFDLEDVNGEIQIVAKFVKNGEELQKIHKVSSRGYSAAEMVAALLDNDFAIKQADEMTKTMNKSTHSKLKES